MILGIDVGLTNIHVFGKDRDLRFKQVFRRTDDFSLHEYLSRFREITSVSYSGNQKIYRREHIGIRVKRMDEIESIGRGGLALSGLKKALVVSCGTGTCIVRCDSGLKHLGGSSIGGGTILGLSKLLLGISSVQEIEMLAKKGRVDRVDYVLSDIGRKQIGLLSKGASVSHFGKLKGHSRADVGLAILNLVGQNIANISHLAAGTDNDLVLVGKVLDIRIIRSIIKKRLCMLGSGIRLTIPADYEYATAIGNLGKAF